MSNAIPDNLKEEIVKKIPLKEQGSVEDIAALTAFLASDDARYITGQVIACDGGMTIMLYLVRIRFIARSFHCGGFVPFVMQNRHISL